MSPANLEIEVNAARRRDTKHRPGRFQPKSFVPAPRSRASSSGGRPKTYPSARWDADFAGVRRALCGFVLAPLARMIERRVSGDSQLAKQLNGPRVTFAQEELRQRPPGEALADHGGVEKRQARPKF